MTSDRAAIPPWRETKARHVYVAYFRVRHHELDSLGHVNNATYLNYLEQAAIDHAAAAGFSEDALREVGGVFVARRHEIDYLQPAKANDLLQVVTWPVDLGAARAIRAYEIRCLPTLPFDRSLIDGIRNPSENGIEGDLIAQAQTVWAFVDTETGRPRRMPREIVREFVIG